MDKQLKSMNDAVIEARREADAAQTTAAITSQLIVGVGTPKLLKLAADEPMVVDLSFINKSNFVASVTGGIVNFRFVKAGEVTMIPADGWIGGWDIPNFDLEPQWSGSIATVRSSRPLTQSEVSKIRDGKMKAYIFFRVFVKGTGKPLDGCYTYDRYDKSLTNCVITNPN